MSPRLPTKYSARSADNPILTILNGLLSGLSENLRSASNSYRSDRGTRPRRCDASAAADEPIAIRAFFNPPVDRGSWESLYSVSRFSAGATRPGGSPMRHRNCWLAFGPERMPTSIQSVAAHTDQNMGRAGGADTRRLLNGLSGALHECPTPAAGWNRVTLVNAAACRCVGWFTAVLRAYTTVLTRLECRVRVRGDFRSICDEAERLRGGICRIEWCQVSRPRICSA
jgi:hypothetical protein